MEFGTITRGDNKIYVSLKADVPEGSTISASSKTGKGDTVPALIAVKDKTAGEYVLILPLLHADQSVSVEIRDEQGDVLEEGACKAAHLSSALAAKLNTLNKAIDVEDIRNFDRFARADVSNLEPIDMRLAGRRPDLKDLVHVRATALCTDPSLLDERFSIRLFDDAGRAIDVSAVMVIGDNTISSVPGSSLAMRVMDISFSKDRADAPFFIWIEFEDKNIPSAFVHVRKDFIFELRGRFENQLMQSASGPEYERWFFETQKTSPLELDIQRSAHFEIAPRFSFVVPLFKTPVTFFEEMARSILDQTYPNLELVLVNASPEDLGLKESVHRCVAADERVRVVELDGNLGIVGNTNAGIEKAQGDFLCFMDHDDVIEPSLLYEYVRAINRYPETDLLYCDEDKLADGRYEQGYLKPDFGWELLTTHNFVCHLLAVRKSVVDSVEPSGKDVEGAQDWDMTMKAAEKARNVFHVRKVLYHWRVHQASVAATPGSKPYTHLSGETALKHHFDRIGMEVRIHDGAFDNDHRIEYVLPEEKPLVSIVIPNKDQAGMLKKCIDSVFDKTTYADFEIVIVENNSEQPQTFSLYEELQKQHANVRVVTFTGEFNYSAICNLGAQKARGSHLLFLNNDIEVITPEWIELLLGPLQRDEVAVTGAKLLFPDDTIQHVGVVIPRYGPLHVMRGVASGEATDRFTVVRHARDVLAVTGACLMVSKEDFDSIGGFDECFVVAYNDVDLCLRLKEKGKHTIIEPNVSLYHHESVSRGHRYMLENRMRNVQECAMFEKRWPRYTAEGDPWYGINVRDESAYYALEWHARCLVDPGSAVPKG